MIIQVHPPACGKLTGPLIKYLYYDIMSMYYVIFYNMEISMKRMIFLLILVCAAAAFVFAENFTVVSVTGRVEKESGNQRVVVRVNEVIDGNVVIHTSADASVVLRDESGRSVTVAAGRDGSVAELTRATTPSVRVGGTINRTDTSAASRTTTQVGTASARASTSVVDIPEDGNDINVVLKLFGDLFENSDF
jgi:hypothetical protein